MSSASGFSLMTILIFTRYHIYFDGALPLEKRPTRLARLEKSRKKLEDFCSNTRGGFPVSRPLTQRPIVRLHQVMCSHKPVKRFMALPENPFMVSAVFEDLKHRWNWCNIKTAAEGSFKSFCAGNDVEYPWADITEIVPGEADVYCGYASRHTGSAVLSNDSDLLVHDLGPQGSVVFLETVELTDYDLHNPQDGYIRAMELHPGVVARKLGIPSILPLAYELKCDQHVGLAELIRRSKDRVGVLADAAAYLSFMQEYGPLSLDVMIDIPGTRESLQTLDIRIAELYLQYELAKFRFREAPHIYLSILHEDHARRCAWNEGKNTRRLGYSLLNASYPSSRSYHKITECVRRGNRICFDTVALHSETQVQEELHALQDRLIEVGVFFNGNWSSLEYWKMFSLNEVYNPRKPDSTMIPNRAELENFLLFGQMGAELQWKDLHIFAQMQSVLYSLRILAQLFHIVALKGYRTEGFQNLQRILFCLPPLHELISLRDERLDQPRAHDFVHKFFELQGQEDHNTDSQSSGSIQIKPHENEETVAEEWVEVRSSRRGPTAQVSWKKIIQERNMNVYDVLGHR